MTWYTRLASWLSKKDPVIILEDTFIETNRHEDKEISTYYVEFLRRWRLGTLLLDHKYCSKDAVWLDAIDKDKKPVLRVYMTTGISDRFRFNVRTSGSIVPQGDKDIYKNTMPNLYNDFNELLKMMLSAAAGHPETANDTKVLSILRE